MILQACVYTHVGRCRMNNEDNYYLCGAIKRDLELPAERNDDLRPANSGALYAVCDGIGGEEMGEAASLAAVSALRIATEPDPYPAARQNTQDANNAVWNLTTARGYGRVGTTIAALSVNASSVLAYNVGDSRIYRYHTQALTQLSKDHTATQQMVILGALMIKKRSLRDRNKLMLYLGLPSEEMVLEPYISETIPLQSDDVYILCSDGLYTMVSDESIAELVSIGGTAEQICTALVDETLLKGAKDNVTVLVVKVVED